MNIDQLTNYDTSRQKNVSAAEEKLNEAMQAQGEIARKVVEGNLYEPISKKSTAKFVVQLFILIVQTQSKHTMIVLLASS